MNARDTLEAYEGAHIKTVRLVNASEHTVTGSLGDVLKAVRALFIQWPPLGYGTKVSEMKSLDDGTYCAVVWRSNSTGD